MEEVPFEGLESADLVMGAVYRGGPGTKTGDDPLSRLLGVGNQGGFRKSGNWRHPNFVALYTTEGDPAWPDEIDPVTQRLTYYGDNKKAGVELLNTSLKGNRILKAAFESLEGDRSGVPPFFVFVKAGHRKDMVFRGLAVPGNPEVEAAKALEVVREWGGGGRFENYKATFTILDVPTIDRQWLGELREGEDLGEHCPDVWRRWRLEGDYGPRRREAADYKPRVGHLSPEGSAISQATSEGIEPNVELSGRDLDGNWRSTKSGADNVQTLGDPEGQDTRTSFNGYLDAISDKSFGGDDNAEDLDGPAPSVRLPVGPGMPGADEAIEWFRSRLETPDSKAFLLLVGGPGNGKSYLARQVAGPLEEIDPQHLSNVDVPRTRHFRTSAGELTIVNDATIPIGVEEAPLISELEGALAGGSFLLANANRGILVEELGASSGQGLPVGRMGRALVQWLLDKDEVVEGPFDVGGVEYALETDPDASCPFLRKATISGGDKHVDVVAVYLDMCSLFEARPEVELSPGTGIPQAREPYRIEPFSTRNRVDERSSAGPLLARVVDDCPDIPELPEGTIDPIAANFMSLANPTIRSGVFKVLRASELRASRRMTYRDLWGAIEQLTRGPLCPKGAVESPQEWVVDNQPRSAPELDDLERLRAILKLAQARFHQALFGARSCPLIGGIAMGDQPATELARQVDPVIDALPGDSNIGVGEDHGWASPVTDAFEGRDSGDHILQGLCESLRREGRDDDPFLLAVTSFEEQLDDAVTRALDGALEHRDRDEDSRELLSWYGEYLLRLYATAHGIPAHAAAFGRWTEAWDEAHENPKFPGPLRNELEALLRPGYQGQDDGRLLLPVFDSRTAPLVDEVVEPTVVKAPPKSDFQWRTNGDFLYLILGVDDQRRIEIDFDFPMLHEAMSCTDGFPGLTEGSHRAAPRLERFRSAMLQSDDSQLLLVGSESIESLRVRRARR